ncbi:MAG: hypothetical protein ACHQII_02945 [Bacteroidia bacterium]
MSLTRKKIWLVNISVSVIVFSLLCIFPYGFINVISSFPQLVHKHFASVSINLIDWLIISCIPVWTYPIYQKDKSISAKRITLINASALLILLLTCLVAFVVIAFFIPPPSLLFPLNYVYMPFSFFPTLVFMAGMFFTYFFHEVLALKRRNKTLKM